MTEYDRGRVHERKQIIQAMEAQARVDDGDFKNPANSGLYAAALRWTVDWLRRGYDDDFRLDDQPEQDEPQEGGTE